MRPRSMAATSTWVDAKASAGVCCPNARAGATSSGRASSMDAAPQQKARRLVPANSPALVVALGVLPLTSLNRPSPAQEGIEEIDARAAPAGEGRCGSAAVSILRVDLGLS